MAAGNSRYLDIAADLRTRVLGGEWGPGANLPRMTDLARQYGVNRDTLARAIAILEAAGLVWAVPRRGTMVRHGMVGLRRTRGNLVRRESVAGTFVYSFPAASGQEAWKHHITPTARLENLADSRLARLLGVSEGTEVVRHCPKVFGFMGSGVWFPGSGHGLAACRSRRRDGMRWSLK